MVLDGSRVRVQARRARKNFDPEYIEMIGHLVRLKARPFIESFATMPALCGNRRLPVPASRKPSRRKYDWLKLLSYKELFSVRLGILKFRGFVLKKEKIPYTPGQPLTDDDFTQFEQKGVHAIGIDWRESRLTGPLI